MAAKPKSKKSAKPATKPADAAQQADAGGEVAEGVDGVASVIGDAAVAASAAAAEAPAVEEAKVEVGASVEVGKPPSAADGAAPVLTAQEAMVFSELGDGVHVVRDEAGNITKRILFTDDFSRAVGEAISECVQHPQGNVDDEDMWPAWSFQIARVVAAKMGVRRQFVSAAFYQVDRFGEPFPDENWVRVSVKLSDSVRHTVLVDPTPED